MKRFRNLLPDEIEVRIGHEVGKDTGVYELLLYQNGRVGQNLLDEVYGDDWGKDYKPGPNGMLLCGIAIFNHQRNAWIWRWDAGAEQNFEKEKSLATDSFKRACVCWGLGRELYSAPRIKVTPKSKYATYSVQDIGYDSKDRIKDLTIVDNNGEVVFDFQDGKEVKLPELNRTDVLKAVCSELKIAGEDTKQLLKFFEYYGKKAETFDVWNTNLVRKLWGKWKERAK